MKKLQFISLLTLGLSTILFFNNNTDSPDVIYWSDNQLTWDDFQGNPRYDHRGVSAVTTSGIVHYRGCKDDNINFKIRAYFQKDESWVKDEAYTDYHLAHEQLHFDITELFARKLRKALSDRAFKCGEEADFEQFINQFTSNWQVKQQAYDMITRHSLDPDKQLEWRYKIKAELMVLDDYKE